MPPTRRQTTQHDQYAIGLEQIKVTEATRFAEVRKSIVVVYVVGGFVVIPVIGVLILQ